MLLDILQGSDMWLEMRRNFITATDASVIMGNSPYCTPYDLWRRKLGFLEPQPVNSAMLRGKELEDTARKLADEFLGMKFKPMVAVPDEPIDYAMASLDGISDDEKMIIEIKCGNKKDHADTFKNKIPKKYEDQLQWQMVCTGLETMYYVSYYPNHDILDFNAVEIFIDYDYLEDHLLPETKKFFKRLKEFDPPEEPVKRKRKKKV